MKCRFCNENLSLMMVDLGYAPPSNAFLYESDLCRPEIYYPLRVRVCEKCWLAQTEDYAREDQLFDQNYVYFSSVSKGWLEHARKYCKEVINELSLNEKSLVVELACNDGYLLKNFVSKKIPCIGVEPTESTAKIAKGLKIPIIQEFFTEELGRKIAQRQKVDLVIANNVLAHVPDINDFCRGVSLMLRKDGVATFEFPHLLNLMRLYQFDTIYHEHYSYLSLTAVKKIFKSNGLKVFDVKALHTHGGSLRVYACLKATHKKINKSVQNFTVEEKNFGLTKKNKYIDFQKKVNIIKNSFLEFLLKANTAGMTVSAYGAAAKGNTLLNFAGVKSDLLTCVYDENIYKQNKFLPGSHIPVLSPNFLIKNPPDYLVIFPWNIKSEIIKKYYFLRDCGTKFVTFEPGYREI